MYYFVRESIFQNTIPFTNEDIHSVHNGDTTYKSSPKIYSLNKEEDLRNLLAKAVGNIKQEADGKLIASFIVSKEGIADSLNILQNLNPKFDKAFLKVFNKAKNEWTPAQHNGKSVNTHIDFIYNSATGYFEIYTFGQKANEAYFNKDYGVAMYYYDKVLAWNSDQKEELYKRGICKQKLGDTQGAIADWKKVEILGNPNIRELIRKHER